MDKEKVKPNVIKGLQGSTRHDQLNVIKAIEYAGTIHGYREVVTRMPGYWHRYTYRDMLGRVRRLASALKSLGVEPGDIVGIWSSSNTYRNVELAGAIPGLGAISGIVNFTLPEDDIIYMLNHAIDHAPYKLAFVEDDPLTLMKYELIVPRLKKPFEKYIIIGDSEKTVATATKPAGFTEDLIKNASEITEWPEIDEYAAATYMGTSATTGRPKALLHTHRGMWLQCTGQALTYGLSPMDTILVLPPFTHGGFLFHLTATMVGAKMVLTGPMPKASDWADCLIKERVTFTGGVPTMFVMILDDIRQRQSRGEKVDLSGLKILFAGQAPSEALIDAYQDLGASCIQGYGCSEGCGPEVVNYVPRPLEKESMSPAEYRRFLCESSGYPCLGVEVKIIGENNEELPRDGKSIGEIHAKIPWGVDEYWMMPEETKKGFDENGWLKSGDLGSVDAHGCIRLHDRVKDAIKSGGEWISSSNIEGLICSFTPVSEACVVEVEHEKWGGRPVALVTLRSESKGKITERDIKEYLQKKVETGEIAKFHIPDKIFIVDEIDKTPNMKFDKKVIRDRYRKVLLGK